MEWLTRLLGLGDTAGPDSEAQLNAARGQGHTRHDEDLAKANGFNNAAEMHAWARNREDQHGGTVSGPGTSQAEGASMLYPRNMLNYILGKYQGATGQ